MSLLDGEDADSFKALPIEGVLFMKKIACLACASIVVAGCAFSSVNRTPPNRYAATIQHAGSFPGTVDQALASAKSVLEAMGFVVQSVTPELGVIRTTPRAALIPDICDCGTWNGSTVGGTGLVTAVVNVTPANDTVVRLDVQCFVNFTGRNLYGAPTHQESYQCASRGAVEKEFFATLQRAIDIQRAKERSPSNG